MVSDPIKFRCYRCQQLLGASRSKVGGTVTCPKCSAELVIPEPDETATHPGPSADEDPGTRSVSSSGPSSGAASGVMDSGITLDVLDMRPEDIRVEPGIRFDPPPPSAPWSPPRPAPAETPAAAPAPAFEPREPAAPGPSALPPDPAPVNAPTAAASALPPIRLDSGPAVNTSRLTLPARPRDLILPRSVVAAWSVLVLVALAFAFLTGLLAGHFVWKVH